MKIKDGKTVSTMILVIMAQCMATKYNTGRPNPTNDLSFLADLIFKSSLQQKSIADLKV